MGSDIAQSLITCVSTLGGIAITQVFSYLNSKNNQSESVFKQQYDKIFSPIHKVLFFNTNNEIEKISKIYNILDANYNLVSNELIESFSKCNAKHELTEEFKSIIECSYNFLKNKLGFSKIEMKKEEKAEAKKYVSKDTKKIISSFIFDLLTAFFCVALLLTAFSTVIKSVTLSQNTTNILVVGVTLGIIIFLIFVFIFIFKYKYE